MTQILVPPIAISKTTTSPMPLEYGVATQAQAPSHSLSVSSLRLTASGQTSEHANSVDISSINWENLPNPEIPEDPNKEMNHEGDNLPAVEESLDDRLQRLGRQRPEVFKSTWSEVGFVFSVSMASVLSEYFVSGFAVLIPTIAKDLTIPAASTTWPASAFSLTLASFLLIFGRAADIYGGYPVYVLGLIWLAIWSIIGGFSINEVMLNFCRALAGLGPAAFLPSSIMILGSIYRPGPRKNLVFSIYGACAPLGFFIGIFFAGLTGQYNAWPWFFWAGGIMSAITGLIAYLTVPSDIQEKRNATKKIGMDWLGGILLVCGFILFTFAIIDSSHAPNRWQNPYIYTLFILGSLLLLLAAYVEARIASEPLLPSSLFKVPCMPALIIALLFTYGSLGIFFLYGTLYMTNIMSASPLQISAWFTPMALGGCIIATVGGFILHRLPGTLLIIFSGISWIIAPLLFAIAPLGANYWAYIFPSMICATIGIDITYNVANIFITTSLPKSQQGLAGAVIMLLLQMGIAVWLGLGDIVVTYVGDRKGLKESYQAAFWFEVACAGVAIVVLVFFVKIEEAKSELTVDERCEMGREMDAERGGGVEPEESRK